MSFRGHQTLRVSLTGLLRHGLPGRVLQHGTGRSDSNVRMRRCASAGSGVRPWMGSGREGRREWGEKTQRQSVHGCFHRAELVSV